MVLLSAARSSLNTWADQHPSPVAGTGFKVAAGDLTVVTAASMVVRVLGTHGIKIMMGALLKALAKQGSQQVADQIAAEVFRQIAQQNPRIKSTRRVDADTQNIIHAGQEAAIVIKPDGSVYYGRIPVLFQPGDPRPSDDAFWRPETGPWLRKIDPNWLAKNDKDGSSSLAW
jgi:hypothetical protein